ncbi:P1 family peptidase [Streptacidiphilus jiangxiensis]|uniref:D-aminopeptidase n=1 Tax=Streptacidiphilus jiangxiensis TaxID=235985 RepID=A0A1H7X734_STRJI|nr:P1 family peptidase [Streptacidiphilus jiangxiensis]SEM29672.1 D-aminopeptidase [Streptacidiphilus jiangxiensis]
MGDLRGRTHTDAFIEAPRTVVTHNDVPAATRGSAGRLRTLGESVGRFPVGRTNTIVDVPGLRVGQTTVTDGQAIFSGVTALVIDDVSPHRPAHAGLFVGNGHGKFVGATQIDELGEVETPIVLTSTLSAFRAADAVVTWVLRTQGEGGGITSVNPVVGEINDSWLSAGDPRPVTAEHVLRAIDSASSDPVELGNVGGGTGACALGFKGGIGSSSRIVSVMGERVTVGALVQANMDGPLRACGNVVLPSDYGLPTAGPATADGSCMVVLAVDAPFDTNTLRRLASRGVFALARVGARFSHGSGDYGLAVSTSLQSERFKPGNDEASVLFEAAMDTVEEAVLDSLLAADTVPSANGRLAAALPARSLSRGGAR